MKINITPYQPDWPAQFEAIAKELKEILGYLNPRVEHFGSTAVPGLAAKPVIDVLVGLESKKQLDETITPMIANQYIYYAMFNATAPDRRLFVGLKDKKEHVCFKPSYDDFEEVPHAEINLCRKSHVHIWEFGSKEWIRHIAFRDYLQEHPNVRDEYAAIKNKLGGKNWNDGMDYNSEKDAFLKREEKKANVWYQNKQA